MEKTQQMREMMMQGPGEGAPAGAELTPQETPIPTGSGFGKLQREIISSM